MKDLTNIFLMAVVVLGWAMLEVTGWCYAVLAIPVVYWLKPVLDLLHNNYWVSLAFWGLVALFAWQGSLIGGMFYGLLAAPKNEGAGNVVRKKSSIRLVSNGYDIQTGGYVGSPFW
ncbi:hypothetical protein [Aeromonas veronii]|uniref:hypothetical protein n=1 Tax=Aeromonas veronii TaxID=654 RepID=UPI002B46CF64|nr:hypothetical protein [Aeromonas veronii]